MRTLLLAALILYAMPSEAGGMWRSHVLPGQVRCSSLPAISATPVSATTSSNLATELAAACGAGPGILELAAGTYTDTNLVIGTGGVSIGGECEIRAANPASKPLLRATVGTARAVIQVRNVTHRIRLTDLAIDGRRADQTDASMSAICTDTTPADGVCDSGDPQNTAAAMGVDSRITSSGDASTCALRVDVIETVGDAFFLRDQKRSAVEDSTVDGAGCDTTTCPTLTVPADAALSSITVNGRGVNFVDSDDAMAVDVTVNDVTKQGIQCYNSTDCYAIGSTVTVAGSTGITMLASSGSALGNTINGVGSNWAQNSTTVSNGEGILFTDGALAVDFDASARGNTILNTWGNGIRAELAAGTPPEPVIKVERNTATTVCTGSTLTTNAGMSFGDAVDSYERIDTASNTVDESSCATGIRVRNVLDYSGTGNVVTGSLAGDGVTYAGSVIAESSLTTDEDIEIGAATTGTLSGCTLNGGAVVNDASSGGVTRSGGC